MLPLKQESMKIRELVFVVVASTLLFACGGSKQLGVTATVEDKPSTIAIPQESSCLQQGTVDRVLGLKSGSYNVGTTSSRGRRSYSCEWEILSARRAFLVVTITPSQGRQAIQEDVDFRAKCNCVKSATKIPTLGPEAEAYRSSGTGGNVGDSELTAHALKGDIAIRVYISGPGDFVSSIENQKVIALLEAGFTRVQ
jgi:hypothetical protein